MPESNVQLQPRTDKQSFSIENGFSLLTFLCNIPVLHSLLKWILHILTGTCELERIICNTSPQARSICTLKVASCLVNSKSRELSGILQKKDAPDDLAERIITVKKIKTPKNSSFFKELKICIEQLQGYESVYCAVEEKRCAKYQDQDESHEDMLKKLWELLKPSTPLESRISKQWGEIGFQGDDPKTDFRGMGLLGLVHLLYFAEHHNKRARKVLQHSIHPRYGYSYAIVGINLTSMAYEFLCSGLLKSHFFNHCYGAATAKDFNEVYCYLFYEFDKYWVKSEPENVMAFGRIRDEFKVRMENNLRNAATAHMCLEPATDE